MTLLITGSSGHLGQAIVTLLRRAGRPAVGIDTRPADTTNIVGSITNPDTVAQAMSGITGVIHTATLHKPHVATHNRQDFVDTNITGTLNLLTAAKNANVAAFVFTSTTSAFGRSLTPGPDDPAAWITEAVTDRPKNIYGATKSGAKRSATSPLTATACPSSFCVAPAFSLNPMTVRMPALPSATPT